jgi:protein involved in sex pheromone biosynthesis
MKANLAIQYLILTLILSSCGPKAADKNFKDVTLQLGPRLSDTKIDTSKIELLVAPQPNSQRLR